MSKLVKIKSITLYGGFTKEAADVHEAIELLEAAGIQYGFLNYGNDKKAHAENFTALSTWTLGPDGVQKECSKFPILTYDLCYEDWTITREIDHGIEEIRNSVVLKNPDLT